MKVCGHILPCSCADAPAAPAPSAPIALDLAPSNLAMDTLVAALEAPLVQRPYVPAGDHDALALVARDALIEGRIVDAASLLNEVPRALLERVLAEHVNPYVDDETLDELYQYIDEVPEMLAAAEVALARASLADFIIQGWHVVEPSTALEWNWHHQLICDVAQGMFEDWCACRDDAERELLVQNAVYNVPPGSLKSRILSVFFPVWCWLRVPGFKVICLSVNQDASYRDGRDSRALIRSEWFQQSFLPKWGLLDDQDAISNYGNTLGGTRISRAQGSEIVGLRGDLLVIDDPNNPKEAENENVRTLVNDLWDANIFNRVNDMRRSLRMGVQQRTHDGDWTGHVLLRQGVWRAPRTNGPDDKGNPRGWLHVVLPAEFELSRRAVTPWGSDPRTFEGESIHPTRLTPDVIIQERARLADRYVGQMQQRPTQAEGGRIKRACFNFFRLGSLGAWEWDGIGSRGEDLTHGRPPGTDDEEPRKKAHVVGPAVHREGWDLDWLVITVDAANKKTVRGSNYGILVVGGKGNRRFVLDDKTRRGEFTEILQVLRELIKTWHPDRLLIEDKAAGPSIISALREEIGNGAIVDDAGRALMLIIDALPANGEFEQRVDGVLNIFEAGLVYLLDGAPWLEEFVKEFAAFPAGVRDDRIDALCQVLMFMREIEGNGGTLPEW